MKNKRKIFFGLIVTLLLCTGNVFPQIIKPVKWSYSSKRISATEAIIFIKATMNRGWHIYSANQPDNGPIKTSFSFKKSINYLSIGSITEPIPISKYEDVFNMQVKYFENSVVFSQKFKLKSKQVVVLGKVEFMACTNKECLPPDEVEFSIPIK